MSLAARLAAIRARVEASARAAGRDPASVRLVAVSKLQPVEAVLAAHDLGVRDFGENTVQGLCAKAEVLAAAGREARWHLIGTLQRNKVNKVAPHLHLLHTLDRPELAEALSRRAPAAGLDFLVEVNLASEPQKGGLPPEGALALAHHAGALPGLRLRGLMAIPPAGAEPRPHFEALAQLLAALRATPAGAAAHELSMGMSDDFETAIACGATLVRVGTAIFGERPLRGRGEESR